MVKVRRKENVMEGNEKESDNMFTKMDKIWVTTAMLLHPDTTNQKLVTRREIENLVWQEWQTEITPIMIEKHLVSWEDRQADKKNISRGGSRNRYLFKTVNGATPSSAGKFRLYKKDDEQYDGWDKTGPTYPKKINFNDKYHYLIDWYLRAYF